jgi:hypothetical protein
VGAEEHIKHLVMEKEDIVGRFRYERAMLETQRDGLNK